MSVLSYSQYVRVFNTLGHMCLCLIKLAPTEFLRASLGINWLIWQICIELFWCVGLLLGATDITRIKCDPFPVLPGAQNRLGETNNWIAITIPHSMCFSGVTHRRSTAPFQERFREITGSWNHMRQDGLDGGNYEQGLEKRSISKPCILFSRNCCTSVRGSRT